MDEPFFYLKAHFHVLIFTKCFHGQINSSTRYILLSKLYYDWPAIQRNCNQTFENLVQKILLLAKVIDNKLMIVFVFLFRKMSVQLLQKIPLTWTYAAENIEKHKMIPKVADADGVIEDDCPEADVGFIVDDDVW